MAIYQRAHKKLDVWQESVALAVYTYQVTEQFPKTEVYSLTAQMRRAAVSVPSNIAEGAARHSTKEFAQFLNIAGGSLSELDTQVEIATQLGYISSDEKNKLVEQMDLISRKLAGLINKIKKNPEK